MSPAPVDRLRALADPVMTAIARVRPVYSRLFAEGDASLGHFLAEFSSAYLPPLQDRSDYIAEVEAHARASQGEALAARVRARLTRSPLVYTANHLCVECMPLTVQSMIIAALGEDPAEALPVEASALIPADNASYPVGLMLARRHEGKPLRVPILDLSNKQRRQMTLLLDPFGEADLAKAEARVRSLVAAGYLGEREAHALEATLSGILRAPEVVGRPTFREQVTSATPRLWERWFTPEARRRVPPLAYATFESIRTPLLIRDLEDPGSPIHRLFFDAALRGAVLEALDGVPCCWSEAGRGGGSALLWEVTDQRRTSPLVAEGGHLLASDGRRIALEPAPILEGLRGGNLVPTSFLSLATGLVRGLVQVGGFNQVDYLAAMQLGLSRAMASTGYGEWAARLAPPLPALLTAGLAGLLATYADGPAQSAGGMEVLAHGGLSPGDLDQLTSLSLREAMGLELPGIARMVLGEQGLREARLPDGADWVRLCSQRMPALAC
ncbi:MAG: hypothetical protein HYZ13_01155 [Acidobacteria bacterium]|nr:hypothetical protein [Acidobacteriota bacterium]